MLSSSGYTIFPEAPVFFLSLQIIFYVTLSNNLPLLTTVFILLDFPGCLNFSRPFLLIICLKIGECLVLMWVIKCICKLTFCSTRLLPRVIMGLLGPRLNWEITDIGKSHGFVISIWGRMTVGDNSSWQKKLILL